MELDLVQAVIIFGVLVLGWRGAPVEGLGAGGRARTQLRPIGVFVLLLPFLSSTFLADLGLVEEDGTAPRVPIVEAWNKWDLLDAERAAELSDLISARSNEVIVPVSALSGLGCAELLEAVSKLLTQGARLHSFVLPVRDGQRLAWLHAHGEVLADEEAGDDFEWVHGFVWVEAVEWVLSFGVVSLRAMKMRMAIQPRIFRVNPSGRFSTTGG